MLLVQLITYYYRLYYIKIARPDYVNSRFSYEIALLVATRISDNGTLIDETRGSFIQLFFYLLTSIIVNTIIVCIVIFK